MVVRNDEDVDDYGDGIWRDPARRAVTPATHLQPNPPYYFILTAYHSPNTKHHNAYHASHNPLDNGLSDNVHDNALYHAHDNAQRKVASATALSPL